MIKDYLADSGHRHTAEMAGKPPPREDPALLREFQSRWNKMLTRCYELYAEGKRCIFEDDPLRRFDCSRCEHRNAEGFCRSNSFLKRLVNLVAEYLARGPAPPRDPAAADASDGAPPAPTRADIDDFKAQRVCYEIETPLCKEHVWLVPEHTGKDRLEFTPGEIQFLAQAANTLEGTLVEVSLKRKPSQARSGE